jgi:hypothetical protein
MHFIYKMYIKYNLEIMQEVYNSLPIKGICKGT